MNPSALDTTFAALADPTRRAILTRLRNDGATVLELARPFRISLPAVSKHLKVLENAHLIAREKKGRVHRIRLNAAPMQEASQWMERYRVFWQKSLDRLEAYLNQQEQVWDRTQSSRSTRPSPRPVKKSSRRGQRRNS